MRKTVLLLCVAIICSISFASSAKEIYLFGSATGYSEPSQSNQSIYADWALPETYDGSNVYEQVFNLSAGFHYMRFYTALTGWSGNSSIGSQVSDSPVSIEINGVYYASFVSGAGMWQFDWTGGLLKIIVDFNSNMVTFDADNTELTYYTENGITYKKTSATEVTVFNVSASGDVVIPSTVSINNTEYSVTEIYYGAFTNCTEIITLTIPNSIQSVVTDYFDNCEALEAIYVDENHSTLSSYDGVLFSKDKTILIYCPKGKSGDYVIPDGVVSIGKESEIWGTITYTTPFKNCKKLTSISIPASVAKMQEQGDVGFMYCSELKNIVVSEANEVYASIDGVLTSKDKTKLIYYPNGRTAEAYVVPQSVTLIGCFAFCDAKLSSVTISENVATIYGLAFAGCVNLTEINFNAKNCAVNLSIGVGTSSVWPNNGANFANINIGESVECLNNRIFSDIILDKIVIPDNVTTIASQAFTNVKNVEIGSGATSINPKAFGYNVEAYEVSENNNAYMAYNGVLFSKDKTTIVDYPSAKTDRSYRIPSFVTAISNQVFNCNASLESVEIPASVTSFGYVLFYDNSNLKGIVSLSSVAVDCGIADAFGSNNEYYVDDLFSNVTLYVPVGASESYKNTVGWSAFVNVVEGASSDIKVTKNIENAGNISMPEAWVIGDNVTVTATACDGYEFDSWEEDGVNVGSESSYTFTVGLSRNIVAKFSPVVNENEVEVVTELPNTASITMGVEAEAIGYTVNIYSDESRTLLVATQNYDSDGNIVPQSTSITLVFDDLEIGSYFYEIVVKTVAESGDEATEETVASVYVGTFAITVSGIESIVYEQISCVAVADGINVVNASGETVSVYDMSGRLVAQIGISSGSEIIPLQRGVYIVQIGQSQFKLKV